MAWFDSHRNTLTVRVVYDGAANSGKSTNVFQLVRIFQVTHAGQLLSSEPLASRTQRFDLAEFEFGYLNDWSLRCQVVSIPGQVVLSARRLALLRSADAIVFVCDSRKENLLRARAALRVLETVHLTPNVVQANCQDCDTAVSPHEVLEALQLPLQLSVVGASAVAREGVRETIYQAIESIRRRYRDKDPPAASIAPTLNDVEALVAAAEQTYQDEVDRALAAVERVLHESIEG